MKVTTPDWDTTGFFTRYKLLRETTINELNEIKGIDWDEEGNLWIVYNENIPVGNGFYEWVTRIAKLNYTDKTLSDTTFLNEYGYDDYQIATEGNLIWFQKGSNPGILKAYNMETGQKEDSAFIYVNSSSTSDMSLIYGSFVFINKNHEYEMINNLGDQLISGTSPFGIYGIECEDLGIAFRDNLFWILNSFYEIAVTDLDGIMYNYIKTDLYNPNGYPDNIEKNTSNSSLSNLERETVPPPPDNGKIAIYNNKLALATYNGVVIYSIVEY